VSGNRVIFISMGGLLEVYSGEEDNTVYMLDASVPWVFTRGPKAPSNDVISRIILFCSYK